MIRARGLGVAYHGGPAVIRHLDLDVAAGEIVLLTGASGGGKSTLLRALCGLVPHFHAGRVEGSLEVMGLDPGREGPVRMATHVGYGFQEPELQSVFDRVESDVAFGPRAAGWPADEIAAAVRGAALAVGAHDLLAREIASLSGGERHRAALAATVATRPSVLLLDEPCAQLDEAGVAQLAALLRDHAARGHCALIAEHRHAAIAAACTRSVRLGERGAAARRERRREPRARPPALLSLEDLRLGYGAADVIAGLSAELHGGVTTVVRGPNGSGKSTLLRAIAGHLVVREGTLRLHGRTLTGPPEARYPAIAMVSQDAARHMLTERVTDEIAYGLRRSGATGAESTERARRVAERFGLVDDLARDPRELSLGMREMVALAGAFAADPEALLLDEPTRGLDAGRSGRLLAALTERAQRGLINVVATHDADFAAAIGDHVLELERLSRIEAAA